MPALLSRLLAACRRRPADEGQALLPDLGEGRRVYAIGDLHGRLDLFDEILAMIARDEAKRIPLPRTLLLLGDLIDRGPQSAQLIDRLRTLMADSTARSDVRAIKGNHEELFLLAARGQLDAVPLFRRAGGLQTLASYGLDEAQGAAMDAGALADWMLNHVPRADIDLLDALPDQLRIGDYLFVHAGIRPGVPIDRQRPADLRWIRRDFLEHRGAHPLMVVHGHSISPDVDERPNRIGIDTGAYRTGRLTALGLEGRERWYLQTG